MIPMNVRSAAQAAGVAVAVALAAGLVGAPQAAGRAGVSRAAAAGCTHSDRAPQSYRPAFQTYDDDIEDSGAAPDFCASEFVTNDTEAITIGIHAHNRSGVMAGDSYAVLLDTDSSPETGGGGVGAEYEITIDNVGAELQRWDGTEFSPVSETPVSMEWEDDYGPLLVLQLIAIGDPTGFNLVFASTNGADADRAPDEGTWQYAVSPFTLAMQPLLLGKAKAGQTFVTRTRVLRSDFDVPLSEGAIGCSAKLAGRVLAGKGTFVDDVVTCTWRRLPAASRGDRLSGSVSVTFQGVRASRAFSVRVG